jgi:hypothetical protein
MKDKYRTLNMLLKDKREMILMFPFNVSEEEVYQFIEMIKIQKPGMTWLSHAIIEEKWENTESGEEDMKNFENITEVLINPDAEIVKLVITFNKRSVFETHIIEDGKPIITSDKQTITGILNDLESKCKNRIDTPIQ